jgi:hypothetical protein
MKPLSNVPRSREREMSSSRCSPFDEIPRNICEQEDEIESMFRDLVRFGDSANLDDSQDWQDVARKHAVVAWILIPVLAFISMIGFYLLLFRVAHH